MKLRDLIGLIVAIVLAVGVALLTRYFLSEEEPAQKKETGQKVSLNSVLVATKELYKGDVIKQGDLIWQQWPESALSPSYIRQVSINLNDLEGAIVKYSLAQGEPVTVSTLIKAGNKGILAALVTPGMRAFSINVSAQSASSGLISPGDYVDVVVGKLVSPASGGNQYGQGRVIVQNVKVLAVDVEMADKHEKPKTAPRVVTLEVSPQQAEDLAAAMKDGVLSLSLHSIESLTKTGVSQQEDRDKRDTVILMRGKDRVEISVGDK